VLWISLLRISGVGSPPSTSISQLNGLFLFFARGVVEFDRYLYVRDDPGMSIFSCIYLRGRIL